MDVFLNKLRNNRITIVLFMVSFLIFFITEMVYRDATWIGDAYDYWNRGEMLCAGNFRLDSIDGFRGYVFPLYLAIVNLLGGKTAWRVVNALILAIFCTFLLPAFQEERVKNVVIQIMQVLLPTIVLDLLFVGLIAYPLTDMIALILMCVAVLFMKITVEAQNKYTKMVCAMCAGFFSYLAYNTRTIYMFAGVGMLIVFTYSFCKIKQNWISKIRQYLLLLLSSGIGLFLAGMPQIVMNKMNLDRITISVPTQGLMLLQMFWGVMYQRYDTYLPNEPDDVHPAPQVYFVDDTGIELLRMMQLEKFSDWGDYFCTVVQHPVDVIAIYVRHFINYIFPCWPEVYVKDLSSIKYIYGIVGFTLLFIMVAVCLEKCYKSYRGLVYLSILLIPAVLIIPGAVEYRFCLPLYLIAIWQIAVNTDWKKMWSIVKVKKAKVCIIYIIMLLLCFAIWSNMLISESVAPLLF